MLTAQDTAVLLAISQAGATVGNWPGMLRALCEYLQADSARLHLPLQGWGDDGPHDRPMPQGLALLRFGRVYTGEELSERPVAPDLGPPAADLRALGLRLADGYAWVVLLRRRGAFRAAHSAALAALAPHLAQALDLAARLGTTAEDAARSRALLRRLGTGMVAWDCRGRMTACDPVAGDILARLPAVAQPDLLSEAQPLRKLAPHAEMLVEPRADGGRVGYLRDTDQALPGPRIIARALGLTLPEARLARALGQGDTLRDAAARLGLTLETARHYSKQIYAKTGLRSQTDLVRQLWRGALILSEDRGDRPGTG